jgi:hypothetical protein
MIFIVARHALVGGLVLLAAVATAASLLSGPSLAADATRHVSTTGRDAGSCHVSRDPCRSLGYAYRQAAPGEVIDVRGGRYGAQLIPRVPGREGAPVELRAAPGEEVEVADLDVAGDHVTIRGIRAQAVSVSAGDRGATPVVNVTLADVRSGALWIQTARDLRVLGGSYGPRDNHPVAEISGEPVSVGVLFDGVDFHDATLSDPGAHTECIWAAGVDGLTIRNSRFRNCAIFDLFLTTYLGPDPRDVLLEGNDFGPTTAFGGADASFSVNVADHVRVMDGLTIRDNTFGMPIVVQPGDVRNATMEGNRGRNAVCVDGVTYRSNRWRGQLCDPSDTRNPAGSGAPGSGASTAEGS